MRSKHGWIAFAGVLSVVLVGCSKGPETAAKRSIDSNQQTTTQAASDLTPAANDPKVVAAKREIGEVSGQFMKAILLGDASGASRWLTPAATQRVAADPSVLTPLGIAVETLKLGEVRLISPSESAAEWVVNEAGSEKEQQIGCLLKLCEAGWRVCGMACDAGPDQAPALISFEYAVPAATPSPNRFAVDPRTEPSQSTVPRTATDPSGPQIR